MGTNPVNQAGAASSKRTPAKKSSSASTVRAPRTRSRRAPDPRMAHLGRITQMWKTEMEKCLEDSGVETVHRIRTGTRRVEAMIDVLMREAADGNPELKDAADRWRRQLKNIRRAAAPVRDLDVHRKILEKFAGVGKAGEEEHAKQEQSEVEKQAPTPQVKDALQTQAEHLDAWLKHAREQRAVELLKQVKKRVAKVDEIAENFVNAWQGQRGRRKPVRKPALAALDAFVKLSDELPMLDAGNLHDFRKGAKNARYMSEAGGDDPQATAVGRTIKRIQDGIGDWHDWLMLSDEARTALREEGDELRVMLDREVEQSFQAAKRATERMRGRLVGEWRALRKA